MLVNYQKRQRRQQSEVTKYRASGAQLCVFESWFHHLLAVCPSSSIK